jgi:hypothetical protein
MEIDPSRRARETSHDDSPLPLETKRQPDAQPEIRHAHETLLDGSARLYAQNATRTNVTGAAPTFNDRILYVGMNSAVAGGVAQNVREERNLGTFGVETIAHGEDSAGVGADHIRVNGHVYDLTTSAGRDGFVATLGLPEAQAKKIAAALAGTSEYSGGPDELAAITQVWARAELGGTIPSRLVLSGHSHGLTVYDGSSKDGDLSFRSIQMLADAMPRAAAQVEDLMISGCNSGHDIDGMPYTKLSSWHQHFPNLKTAWAYSADEAHSPTESHAVSHIAAWRAATAGRTTHVDGAATVRAEYHREWTAYVASHEDAASHPEPTAKLPESVAIWSSTDGYRRGIGRP